MRKSIKCRMMPNGRYAKETFLIRSYENGDDNPTDNYTRLPEWDKYEIEEVDTCPEGVVLINWHDAEDLSKMLKGNRPQAMNLIKQMKESITDIGGCDE